jgi:hypothetical protein
MLLVAMIIAPAVCAENVNVTPVSTPFITIDPIGNHTIGDVFFVNGTTNLPATENLSLSFSYTFKMQSRRYSVSPNTSAEIPDISISSSTSGTNRWSVNATDILHELNGGEYFVYVHSYVDYTCHTPGCSVPKAAEASVFTLFSVNNGTLQKSAQIQSTTGSETLSAVTLVSPTLKQSPGYDPIITLLGLCAIGLIVRRP